MTTIECVRSYIIKNFLFGEERGLQNSESLIDQAIIDSTGIMELVTFIEETFNLHIKADELLTENFESIQRIANFIEQKRGVG